MHILSLVCLTWRWLHCAINKNIYSVCSLSSLRITMLFLCKFGGSAETVLLIRVTVLCLYVCTETQQHLCMQIYKSVCAVFYMLVLIDFNSSQNTWSSLNYDITLNVIQVICKLLLWYLNPPQHVTLLLNWNFMEYPKRGSTGSLFWAAVTMVPEMVQHNLFDAFFPPTRKIFYQNSYRFPIALTPKFISYQLGIHSWIFL